MNKTALITLIAVCLFSSGFGFWLNGVEIVPGSQSGISSDAYRDMHLNYVINNGTDVLLYDRSDRLLETISGGAAAASSGIALSPDSLVLLAGYSNSNQLSVYYSRRQSTSEDFQPLVDLNLGLTVDARAPIKISQDGSYFYFFDDSKLNIVQLIVNPDGTMSGVLKQFADNTLVSNTRSQPEAFATQNGRFLAHFQGTQIIVIENPISDAPSRVALTTKGDNIQGISISNDQKNFRIAVLYEEAASDPVVHYITIYQYDGSTFSQAYSMATTGNTQSIDDIYLSNDGAILVNLYASQTQNIFGLISKTQSGLDVAWQTQTIQSKHHFTINGDQGIFDILPYTKVQGPIASNNCYDMEGTTGIPLKNGQCQCIVGYHWDSTNSVCKPTCNNGLASSVNANDDMVCDCEVGSVWDPVGHVCVVDCNSIERATRQWITQDVCQCSSVSVWNQSTYTCNLDCRIVEYSTGQSTANGCQCQSGYKWENDQCVVDCAQINHSTGQEDTQNAGQCVCDAAFQWSEGACITTDCSQILNSAGGTADENGDCPCNGGYIWDRSTFQCNYDCQSATDPLSNGQNANAEECQCLSQAVWNAQNNICYRNCELVPFADGNVDSSSCSCKAGYVWIDSLLKCLPQCVDANGQKDQRNSNGFCLCKDGFTINPFQNKCYRVCKDISNAKRSFGPTQSSCYCDSGHQWNDGSATCNLACNGDFDIALINGNTECSCVANALYNSNLNLCELVCTSDTLSTAYDPINKQCVCTQNALWNSNSDVMQCECSNGFSQVNGKCQASVGGSTAIIAAVASMIVSGGSVFAGVKIFQKRKGKKAQQEEVKIDKSESMENVQKQSDSSKQLDKNQVVI